MLKMSVKKYVSSSAQSLRQQPEMSLGPGAFLALVLLSYLLMLSGDSNSTWSVGGRGIFCAKVLLSASKLKSEEVIQAETNSCHGSCHRLLVSLLLLMQSAIFLEYCPLASLMHCDRLTLGVIRPTSSPALKAVLTFPISHGF